MQAQIKKFIYLYHKKGKGITLLWGKIIDKKSKVNTQTKIAAKNTNSRKKNKMNWMIRRK